MNLSDVSVRCHSKTGKFFILFAMLILVNGKRAKNVPPKDEETEEPDAEIFCKKRSRLIRMEKTDEIFVVDSFINSSVLLQCKFCEEKDNGLPKIWSKQKHIFTGNITELEPDMDANETASSMFINKQHSLVLKSLKESDMGMYFCKAPYIDTPEKSFNYLVDLSNITVEEIRGSSTDLNNYTKVYLIKVNEILEKQLFSINNIDVNMMVFTDWSEWSECDSCFRKEGVKYRAGRCRVKPVCLDPAGCLEKRLKFKSFYFDDRQNQEKPTNIQGEVADVDQVKDTIIEFGIALSCRSLLLLALIPDLYAITSSIPDFILGDKCIAPCAGRTHKKGPRYKKSIILAKGAHLTLVCPDSTIDSQVRWEHNKKRLHPNQGTDFVPGTTEPRLYVDSFNTLYLFEVTDEESGNFTCFVDGVRMQEVKIIVLTRSLFFTKEFTRHLKYLGFVFLICFIGYLSGVTVMCVKSKSSVNKSVRIKKGDTEKLLGNESE